MLAGLGDLAFASNLKSLQIHLLTEEPCAFSLAALESLKDLRIVRNPPKFTRDKRRLQIASRVHTHRDA